MNNKVLNLVCVTSVNNNKYYNMTDNGDGTFTAAYGRVGGHETRREYSMRKWESKRREKERRGYEDITSLKGEVVSESGEPIDIDDPSVRSLVEMLQQLARGSLARAYTVSSESVTKAQVEEAQRILDSLAGLIASRGDYREMNEKLLSLYHVIPRRMGQVNDHLLHSNNSESKSRRIVTEEQDNIDTMGQQVSSHTRTKDGEDTLEAMGIKIATVDRSTELEVAKRAGDEGKRVRKVYEVENKATRKRYKDFLASLDEDRKIEELLWHGSRNQNWLSILESGLKIRPSGVVTTGSAFGNGIYFADELGKSLGYTSVDGSYWAGGDQSLGFCALFDVNIGRQLVLRTGNYQLNLDRILRDGYDSALGKKGSRLYRNEFIVYRPQQATIKYLVQIK